MKLLSGLMPIKTDPASILSHRESGEIYCADFGNGKGKYISSVLDCSDPYDVSIKVSSKIEVRLTYIFEKKEVVGIQIAKLDGKEITNIHLSTLDWQGVLKLLHIFSEMDLSAIAHKSLIMDGGLNQNPEELKKFLNTVATDETGREKMKEILKNFDAIRRGDINEIVERKRAVNILNNILNDASKFAYYKKEILKVGKDEEVWQRFFEKNPWILGSDFVEILEERVLDEDSITDLPIKDYDGFVNIIELKLPTEDFWTKEGNPVSGVTKALMQCMRYITEAERRMNDKKKTDKLGADILKPKITLIIGRSKDWTTSQKEQFRILNSSFHNISILTHDHVLSRAKKIIENHNN